MKTKFLNWDVNIQWFLVAVNSLLLLLTLLVHDFVMLLLLLQFFIGSYQLTSSGIHLAMSHKSIGFIGYRQLHFFSSVVYLVILSLITKTGINDTAILVCLFVVIPQVILYAYFFLCVKELHFLQNREFHILR